MDILFIASVSLIGQGSRQTPDLLTKVIGLPLKPHAPDPEYLFSEEIEGAKHFGIWPLTQAAEACFGTDRWPGDVPIPQVSVEFEVKSAAAVADAERELRQAGARVLHATRTEP